MSFRCTHYQNIAALSSITLALVRHLCYMLHARCFFKVLLQVQYIKSFCMTAGIYQSDLNPLKYLSKDTRIALQTLTTDGQYKYLRLKDDKGKVVDFVSGRSNAVQLFVIRNQDGRVAFGTLYKPSFFYTKTATLYLQK